MPITSFTIPLPLVDDWHARTARDPTGWSGPPGGSWRGCVFAADRDSAPPAIAQPTRAYAQAPDRPMTAPGRPWRLARGTSAGLRAVGHSVVIDLSATALAAGRQARGGAELRSRGFARSELP